MANEEAMGSFYSRVVRDDHGRVLSATHEVPRDMQVTMVDAEFSSGANYANSESTGAWIKDIEPREDVAEGWLRLMDESSADERFSRSQHDPWGPHGRERD